MHEGNKERQQELEVLAKNVEAHYKQKKQSIIDYQLNINKHLQNDENINYRKYTLLIQEDKYDEMRQMLQNAIDIVSHNVRGNSGEINNDEADNDDDRKWDSSKSNFKFRASDRDSVTSPDESIQKEPTILSPPTPQNTEKQLTSSNIDGNMEADDIPRYRRWQRLYVKWSGDGKYYAATIEEIGAYSTKIRYAVDNQCQYIINTERGSKMVTITDRVNKRDDQIVFQHRPVMAWKWDDVQKRYRGRGSGKITIYYNKQHKMTRVIFYDETNGKTRLLQYINGIDMTRSQLNKLKGKVSISSPTKIDEVVWCATDYALHHDDANVPIVALWKIRFADDHYAADEFIKTFNLFSACNFSTSIADPTNQISSAFSQTFKIENNSETSGVDSTIAKEDESDGLCAFRDTETADAFMMLLKGSAKNNEQLLRQ